MEQHIDAPGGKPWARVKGTMAATYLHLKEMGWQANFEGKDEVEHVGFLDRDGHKWNFNHEISWHDFEEQVQDNRMNQL